GYPETNDRGLDPRRFGPFVDDENDSFDAIRTDVPPSNKPSIPQSNVHLSNEPVLTNVPQSNEHFQTIPTNVPLSNEPFIPQSSIHLSNEPVLTNVPPSNELMLTNVPLSIEPEPIIGQTKTSVHTCIRVETEGEKVYKAGSSRWVASIIKQKLRKDPNYKPFKIIDNMQIYHNIDATYNLVWRAKEKAHAEMRGSFEHAYQLLTSYFVEVRLADPNFAFDIQTTSCKDKRFTRCICPPQKTYKQLRPVAVIDKTFLTGRYRGTLLTAIAIDPSNYIFLLAFSITHSGTTESWTYFLKMFRSNFHGYDTRFVVISDRNPGIINVVLEVFPFVIHTFCAFYIFNNIKITLESTRIAFRMAIEALRSIDFDKHMNVIHNTDPVVTNTYLLYDPICHLFLLIWHLTYMVCHFFRYGVAYTNHVESWNNVILKVKHLPMCLLRNCVESVWKCPTRIGRKLRRAKLA
ncbi:hypothetical protein GIB67_018968, partial [Kingdonia uniflora]